MDFARVLQRFLQVCKGVVGFFQQVHVFFCDGFWFWIVNNHILPQNPDLHNYDPKTECLIMGSFGPSGLGILNPKPLTPKP